ncbi:MAG: NAD(P)/FAD-dependent oxidoreductase, partial [Candidatus Odinarchaeota archaeon]
MRQEISIIGGNVAGLSAAYHLSKKGFLVTVYEKKIWNKPCGGAISLEFERYLREELAIELEEYDPIVPSLRVGLWSGRYVEDEGVFTVNTRYDLQKKIIEKLREELGIDIIEKYVSTSDKSIFSPQTVVATGYSGFTREIMEQKFMDRMFIQRFDGKLGCNHPNAHLIVLDNRVMGYGWIFIGKNSYFNIGFGADVSKEVLSERYYSFIEMVNRRYGYEIDPIKAKPRRWVLPLPVHKAKYPVAKVRNGVEFIGVGDVLGLAHPITGAGIEPAWQSGWVLAASVNSAGNKIGPP